MPFGPPCHEDLSLTEIHVVRQWGTHLLTTEKALGKHILSEHSDMKGGFEGH